MNLCGRGQGIIYIAVPLQEFFLSEIGRSRVQCCLCAR